MSIYKGDPWVFLLHHLKTVWFWFRDSVKRLSLNLRRRFHTSLSHLEALLIQFHVIDGVTNLFVQLSNKTLASQRDYK